MGPFKDAPFSLKNHRSLIGALTLFAFSAAQVQAYPAPEINRAPSLEKLRVETTQLVLPEKLGRIEEAWGMEHGAWEKFKANRKK